MAHGDINYMSILGGMKEPTYGADPAGPDAVVLPVISCGIKDDPDEHEDNVIRGNANPVMPTYGNHKVGGPVVIPLDLIHIGYWLEMILGLPTTTGAGPYTHVFKIGTSWLSWVLEQGHSDMTEFFKWNGCVVSSANFKFGGGGPLQVSLQIVGAKETNGGSSVDASPTTKTLTLFSEEDITIAEGGSTSTLITELDFTIDNKIANGPFPLGNGGNRASARRGRVSVKGNAKAIFESDTLLNKAYQKTESSLKVTLTSGTSSLELFMPELKYKRQTPIETEGGLYVPLPFTAYYENNADATAFKATLINGQATYPS